MKKYAIWRGGASFQDYGSTNFQSTKSNYCEIESVPKSREIWKKSEERIPSPRRADWLEELETVFLSPLILARSLFLQNI